MNNMQEKLRKNRKILVFTIIGIIAALALWALVMYIINLPKTARVEILLSPESAELKLNGKTYKKGKHAIEPGTYEVTAKKDGFDEYKSSFYVEKGETYQLTVCLKAQDGNNWYTDHPDDYEACQSETETVLSDYYDKKYSDKIFNYVPYRSRAGGYHIGARVDDETGEITVTITNLPTVPDNLQSVRDEAFQYLRDNGIEPNDYKIEYAEKQW